MFLSNCVPEPATNEQKGQEAKKKEVGKRLATDLSPSTDSDGSCLTPRTGTAISEIFLETLPQPWVPNDEGDIRTVLGGAFSPAPPGVLGSEGDWGSGTCFWSQNCKSSPSVCVLVAQSCPTFCNPLDCSPPGSSVHGIHQARILEWIAIPFSRGSSRPRDWTQAPALQVDSLPSEPSRKPLKVPHGM